jgi:hypothetical protein
MEKKKPTGKAEPSKPPKGTGGGGVKKKPSVGDTMDSETDKILDWVKGVEDGIQSLYEVCRSRPDGVEKENATKAIRNIAMMFIRKFKSDALQPWLVELKAQNEEVWNEGRRLKKRHNRVVTRFVVEHLSYFESLVDPFLAWIKDLEDEEASLGEIREELVEFMDEKFEDRPHLCRALGLWVEAIFNANWKNGDVMRPGIAWYFLIRRDAEIYFNLLWPYLEVEWGAMADDVKKHLPSGTQSGKRRISPGVFRDRSFAVVESLILEFPFFVPLEGAIWAEFELKWASRTSR